MRDHRVTSICNENPIDLHAACFAPIALIRDQQHAARTVSPTGHAISDMLRAGRALLRLTRAALIAKEFRSKELIISSRSHCPLLALA